MADKYFVRRDPEAPELHIYIEYSKPAHGRKGRDWLGTLRVDELEWNDHLVPELEDMRFIVNLADNFSTVLAEAKVDAWDMARGDQIYRMSISDSPKGYNQPYQVRLGFTMVQSVM